MGLSNRQVYAVIPARYSSTRLPGKPLIDLLGVPMIVRVYERVLRALNSDVAEIVVATDDERILEVLARRGIPVVMTSSACESGSDRVAEVARLRGWGASDVVLNVQGDEPFVPDGLLQSFAHYCLSVNEFAMGTIAVPARGADINDPNSVKVVLDRFDRAMLFSRAPIPFRRESCDGTDADLGALRHVGIYGYTNAVLQSFASSEPCRLETVERLEQLRALWNGVPISVMRWPEPPPGGIDTESDVARAVQYLANGGVLHDS